MRKRILSQTRFGKPEPGWDWPAKGRAGMEPHRAGCVLSAGPGQATWLNGPGVHTRNGDSIEIEFEALSGRTGALSFGFQGGFEFAIVTLDFARRRLRLDTSEWTRPQPVASAPVTLRRRPAHILRIEKTAGRGRLVKMADVRVWLDGEQVLAADDLDILPEMGVALGVKGGRVLVRRFAHRGIPTGIPEYLHVAGWQVLNRPSIDQNLASLMRGLREAAEQGVQLLVTPETSLTGLFPRHPVTKRPGPVAEAERKLRRFIRGLKDAPYLVAGLPVWQEVPGHRRRRTRYNVSRVYDPDGHIDSTWPKIHSCEAEFHHGYRYQEFDIYGVPVTMHICHDGRYPDVWTVPVMFGARLILHPANGGTIGGGIDVFEARAKRSTTTSHAFYVHVNGGGGSFIAGPQKFNNLIAVSPECRRDVPTFPMVGEPVEGLLHARLRIHDAFGYWPVRALRASEAVAEAYLALYKAMGGRRTAALEAS